VDRGPQFPELKYSYEPDSDKAPHRVTAHLGDEQIGQMAWFSHGDEYPTAVGNLEVAPHHRRKGVATAMWNHAHQLAASNPDIPAPTHHPDRTNAGHAWSVAVTPDFEEREGYPEWEDHEEDED